MVCVCVPYGLSNDATIIETLSCVLVWKLCLCLQIKFTRIPIIVFQCTQKKKQNQVSYVSAKSEIILYATYVYIHTYQYITQIV